MIARVFVVALGLAVALPAVAGEAPPSIDDLDGSTFSVRAKGPQYNLAGDKSKFDHAIDVTITKSSDEAVSFDALFGGMDVTFYYVDGFLLQALATGGPPAEHGSSFFAAVSGKPGRLKLKGTLTVYSAGPGFNVLRVLKISGKQVP